MLRVLVGSFAFWYLFTRYDMLVRIGATDPSLYEPVGVAAWFAVPIPPMVYQVLVIAALVGCMAFILGWRFRYQLTGLIFAPFFRVERLLLFLADWLKRRRASSESTLTPQPS